MIESLSIQLGFELQEISNGRVIFEIENERTHLYRQLINS